MAEQLEDNETIKEAADYFGMTVEEIAKSFRTWLNLNHAQAKEQMDPLMRAICYGIYRIDKNKHTFRSMKKTIDRRGEKIKELQADVDRSRRNLSALGSESHTPEGEN